MIISALKVFDIVYVMTNGNLGTDVIANRMYKEMFNFRNFGRASALAVILLVAIIPVMLLNIRRFGEQGGRPMSHRRPPGRPRAGRRCRPAGCCGGRCTR